MKEKLDELNKFGINASESVQFSEFFNELRSKVDLIISLKRKKNKTEDDVNKIKMLNDEFDSIKNQEKFLEPYVSEIGKFKIQTTDSIGDFLELIIENDSFFSSFFDKLFPGEMIKLSSELNELDDEYCFKIDFRNNSLYSEAIRLKSYLVEKKYGKDACNIINKLNDNYKFFDFNYIYLIHTYKKKGIIDDLSLLIYLNQENDFDSIKKYFENGFSELEKKSIFNNICNRYEKKLFLELINKLNFRPGTVLGEDIFSSELQDIYGQRYAKDLEFSNMLFKDKDMVDFIDFGIENYDDTLNSNVSTPATREDVLNFTNLFLLSIDSSGEISQKFLEFVKDDGIVFFNEDNIDEISSKYNIVSSNLDDQYNVNANKIFVRDVKTYCVFTSIVHEFFHYLSFTSHNKIDKILCEFPSIYFETLADQFALLHGINTVSSKERKINSIEHYKNMKMLFNINYTNYIENGEVSFDMLKQDLIVKYNNPDIINEILMNCYDMLESNKIRILSSYVISTALTSYCINKNIEPLKIYDICKNLYNYSDPRAIIDELDLQFENINYQM